MTAKSTTNPAELIDQATATYFGAVKNALKVQEELVAGWVDVFRKADGIDYLPQTVQRVLKETIPLAEKQTEELLKVVEDSSRQGLTLMADAFEAVRTTKPAETQASLEKLWDNSLTALRDNAEAVVRANAHLAETWMGFAKRNVEGVVPPTTKAA